MQPRSGRAWKPSHVPGLRGSPFPSQYATDVLRTDIRQHTGHSVCAAVLQSVPAHGAWRGAPEFIPISIEMSQMGELWELGAARGPRPGALGGSSPLSGEQGRQDAGTLGGAWNIWNAARAKTSSSTGTECQTGSRQRLGGGHSGGHFNDSLAVFPPMQQRWINGGRLRRLAALANLGWLFLQRVPPPQL